MSYVDDLRDQIEEQLRQAEEALRWIAVNAPPYIERLLNIYLATIPVPDGAANPIADQVIARLTEMLERAREGIAAVRRELVWMGSPDNLRAAADVIDSQVVGAARELAPRLALAQLPSALDSNWNDGDASEGYENAVDGRSEAVLAVDTYSSPVSGALRDLADAIESYYLDLLTAVGGFAVALIGVVVAIAGAATIALLVIGVIGAIGGVVVAVIGLCNLILGVTQTGDSAKGGLTQAVPTWPAAIV